MMKSAQKLLLFILYFSVSSAFGFVYKIDRWEKGPYVIFTLSDWHESIFYEKQIGNQQRKEIVHAAVELGAGIIVEDMACWDIEQLIGNPFEYDYNQNNNYLMPYVTHERNSCYTPITGLTAYCHQIRVPVHNIEFRTLGSLSLQGFSVDPQTVLSFEKKIIEEIEQYNDGPLLNDYYKKKLEEYVKSIEKMQLLFDICYNQNACCLQEALEKTVQEINQACKVDKERYENLKEHCEKIIIFHDAALLDLRIIHSIYQRVGHGTLFVCAGGWHIENIEPALQKMGFIQKEVVGKKFQEKNNRAIEPDIVDVKSYFATNETVKVNRRKELQKKLITQHDIQRKKVNSSLKLTGLGLGTTIGGMILCSDDSGYSLPRDTYLLGQVVALEGAALIVYGFYKNYKACRYKQRLLQEYEKEFSSNNINVRENNEKLSFT